MALNNNELHEIALENLNLLVKEEKNITSSIFVTDGKKLDVVKDDQNGYDTMFTLKELEYPIYFTFHHFMTIITDNNEISYRKRKELLRILDDIFDSLCELSESRETNNKESEDTSVKSFELILNDISERLDTVRERTIVTRCERMYLFFDGLVEALQIVSKHLYVTPFDADDEEEEEDENSEEQSNNSEEQSNNSEEQENNKEPESIFGGFWTQDTSKKAN